MSLRCVIPRKGLKTKIITIVIRWLDGGRGLRGGAESIAGLPVCVSYIGVFPLFVVSENSCLQSEIRLMKEEQRK